MIKNNIAAILIVLWIGAMSGQPIARVENVKIKSAVLNQEREILIYTPVDYDWRIHEFFNVIYVFDSQNREFFDFTSSIISFLTDNSKAFIVIGITSPYNEELDYSRNNDLLPILETKSSLNTYGKYYGNADNFLTYVATEVIPYVDSHYRTLDHNVAIGHSLSASFIITSFLSHPNLFYNYIAISPNLAYDEEKLANQLINFKYSKIDQPTSIFISHANEGNDYWKEWKPAREKIYSFFNQSVHNSNLKIEINEFPENNHWNTFPPSLNKALEFYFKNSYDLQEKVLSKNSYHVTIKVRVPHLDDVLFIIGNQEALGDWNPGKIKMDRISDFERELHLNLKSPAQFKFTRGTWETEAEI